MKATDCLGFSSTRHSGWCKQTAHLSLPCKSSASAESELPLKRKKERKKKEKRVSSLFDCKLTHKCEQSVTDAVQASCRSWQPETMAQRCVKSAALVNAPAVLMWILRDNPKLDSNIISHYGEGSESKRNWRPMVDREYSQGREGKGKKDSRGVWGIGIATSSLAWFSWGLPIWRGFPLWSHIVLGGTQC